MALSAPQRRLFARHLLLPEISTAGQEQLCRTQAVAPADADDRAYRAAVAYLQRAGVEMPAPGEVHAGRTSEPDAPQTCELALPRAERVAELAGEPELEEAAALLSGAFAAVETIKAVVGAGHPAPSPAGLVLARDPEDDPQ